MSKTKKNVISASEYKPSNEKVLMDTNVLIFIFTPYVDISKNSVYLNLWSKISKSRCEKLITAIQLSEFINRCIRIEYAMYKKANGDNIDFKKEYRSSDDYKEKMNDIISIVENDIVPDFTFVDDKFSELDKNNLFKPGFAFDFNDSLLVEITKKYGATLITDDSDYGNYKLDFPIVTNNSFLLSMKH